MSTTLRQFTCQLALLAVALLVLVQCATALPTSFRNRLFDLESSDMASPEFARPDEADLQHNSARLTRTLLLLDPTDLLKNARLFGEKSHKGKNIRAKRSSGLVIRVRKPTLTFHDDHEPSLYDAIEELRKAVPV